jgi:hypothetical protein
MRQEAGRMALESNALGLDERRAAIADRPALQARAEAEHQAKLDLVRAQTDHQRSGASKDDKQGRGFEIENMRKSALELAQRWGTVKTPQDVVPLYVQAVNDGLLTREQAEAEINKTPQDPAQFHAHAQAQFQQGMSFVQKTELALKQRQQQEQEQYHRDTTATQRRGQDMSSATQRRGQNLVDARSRDANGVAQAAGKVPPGYRFKADGTLEPIPGGPADPASKAAKAGSLPTEDERKSAGYAVRMEDALKTLALVGKTNPGATKPGVGTSILNMLPEGVANQIRPEDRQRVEAAQLDALDAALTLATGAAYTKEQLKGLSRAYFAQPGDADKTIEEKGARLQKVIETARVRAGRAAPTIDAIGAMDPKPKTQAFDADKEKRYQEWKARQGK